MAVSGPPARRRPGCLAWGGTILTAVVLLCCLGTAGGGGLGWFTSRPGDTALPPAPAGFPAAAYLPQFDVDSTVAALTGRGFDCGTAGEYPFDCQLPGVTGSRVVAEFHDPTGVRGVTVMCRPAGSDPAGCGEFYALAVDAVLIGSPTDIREQSRDWAAQYTAGDATTVFGEVELTIREFGSSTELRIGGAT